MLRHKKTLLLTGLIFIVFGIAFIFIAGYTNLNQAQVARARGDNKLAAAAYLRAAKFLFWRTDLFEQAGIVSAQASDFPNAVTYFEKGFDFSEEGWIWFCTSYIQLQDFSSAISTCQTGTKQYESASLYRLLAFVYRSQKDWEAERLALENQTRLDQTDAYAAYRLGLLLTLYAPENAIPELTRASTLNPEVDSAAQTLRAALAVSGQQSDPSMQKVVIGQSFGLVQDWELAKTAFEQAVQLNENNAEAWAWLGEAKQQTGQEGSVELDRALLLNHTSVNVRALRGLYWSRQGKYEQMLAEYLLAAGIEPENPRWQASVGEAYSKLGDLVKALAAYQRAVELAPSEAVYWRLLAIFCSENNVQVEEVGLPAAQQALLLAPDDPSALDALGFAYLSTGRFANAEDTLLQAVEIAPEYFPAHIHLAMTYLAQGNQSAAFNSLTYVRDAEGAGVYAEVAQQLLDKYFQ
jgi:tetratricopeptide (TPR) repeat protein